MEGKASGPSGSTPEPSVTRQLGKGLTSPRSVAGSRDGGKSSPSAASLSSVAADDGDAGCITSLGPWHYCCMMYLPSWSLGGDTYNVMSH